MPKKDIICGIDVGSSNIRTIIAQLIDSEEKPRIVGVGVSPSFGVRKGMIVDIEETLKSINDSISQAERAAGANIEQAIVSIGGNHIISQSSKGVIAVGRADGEVTQDDVERVVGGEVLRLNKESGGYFPPSEQSIEFDTTTHFYLSGNQSGHSKLFGEAY